jgi:uncharacterized membrane protein YqjE
MNDVPHASVPHGAAALFVSMARTRLELAGLELESHLVATAASFVSALVAALIALITLVFIGVTVIALFWDTHRLAATLGTTGFYALIACLMALQSRSRWKSRPPPFAAVLHELARDRDALRGRL